MMIWCIATYGIINVLITQAHGFIEFGRHGTAEQSSTYRTYDASMVIDGNKSQKWTDGSCSHTAPFQSTAWWRLDLGKKVMIHNVMIYYRMESPHRLDGYYLFITDTFNRAIPNSGHLCYHDEAGFPYPNLIQNRTCDVPGQNVVIYNTRITYDAILELCEVEVYGCYVGFYGYNCDKNCPVNCVNNLCNVWNGSCTTCIPGYTGDTCDEECISPLFGENCQSRCHCFEGGQCEHVTGKCPNVCAPGWKHENCSEECDQGAFGKGCGYTCNCLYGSPCDHVNGYCSNGCAAGWQHYNCSEVCDHGKFGMNCQYSCHCLDGAFCDHETGLCPDGKCEAGWQHSNCSEECESNKFGDSCNMTCHCLNGARCYSVNGFCPNGRCAAGWKYDSCSEECGFGKFGENCKSTCHCFDNENCNRFTGICANGKCSAGWRYNTCSEECPHGTYGYNCLEKCINCSHSCEPENGKCYIIESQQDNIEEKRNVQMWRNLAIAFIGLFIVTLCTSVLAIILYCRKTIHSKSDLVKSKVQEDQKDVYDTVADVEMTDASKDFPKYSNYQGNMSHQISKVSDEVQQQSVYQELLETRDNLDHLYNK